jgi:hypothetical protein
MPKTAAKDTTTTNEPVEAAAPEFYKDLFALHQELDTVDFIKAAEGSTGNRAYKYLDLPSLKRQINPILRKHNFIWSSKPGLNADGTPTLQFALVHISGQEDAGEMALMSKAVSPQDQGSAITYARRYALTAQLDIVADEDDDASKAQRAAAEAKTTITKGRETDIYTMLERIGVKVEDYEAALTKQAGKHVTVPELTNEQADKEIQRMAAYIQRQRVSKPKAEE